MISLVALGVIAGFLAVDQRAGWQGLLAQPVFAAALVGLVFGQPAVCVCVGLVLELVYLSVVPMRGAHTADQVAAGVVGAGVAGLLMRAGGETEAGVVCTLGIFVGLVAGEVGSRVTGPLFALHNRVLSSVEFARDMPRRRMAGRLLALHAASVGFIFAVEALVVLALSAAGIFSGARIVRLAEPGLTRGVGFWGICSRRSGRLQSFIFSGTIG
jgi:mannose/fructose/N-acetylgalactosamine-specific phosphotransferase system component IIC